MALATACSSHTSAPRSTDADRGSDAAALALRLQQPSPAGSSSSAGSRIDPGLVLPLAVLSQAIDPRGAVRRPTVVSANEVRFSTGASGTCVPVVRAAARHGDTLVLTLVPSHRSCTADLEVVVVAVRLNQPVFDDPALRYLKFGYFGKGNRVPLVRRA